MRKSSRTVQTGDSSKSSKRAANNRLSLKTKVVAEAAVKTISRANKLTPNAEVMSDRRRTNSSDKLPNNSGRPHSSVNNNRALSSGALRTNSARTTNSSDGLQSSSDKIRPSNIAGSLISNARP